MKVPRIPIRSLQFDSFFIECVRNATEEKKSDLTRDESKWLYQSDAWLHRFVEEADMGTKYAILSKLGFHFATTVYSDDAGCDRLKWVEIIAAARGLESAKEWYDDFIHHSHVFVIGSMEMKRILNRIDVMNHSKMYPISRYIKRMRDFKKLANYESLYRQQDFVNFILRIMIGYAKITSIKDAIALEPKELLILVILYSEHRTMNFAQIGEMVGQFAPKYKLRTCLENMTKRGILEKTSHPYNRNKNQKIYTWNISDEGNDFIVKICGKILSFI